MYIVSEDYKTQIRNTLRNPSYIKVDLSIVDPQARGDASLTSTGEEYYSDIDNIKTDLEVNETYMTLEHNRWLLNGLYNPPLEVGETHSYQGYIGNVISDKDGIFVGQPKITVNFVSTYYEFIGLTLDFDTIKGDYPSKIRFIAYYDDIVVLNTLEEFNYAERASITTPIPLCNKLDIIFEETITPFRRPRVEQLVFGIVEQFTEETIESAVWNRSIELVNSKLPEITFDFTIIDIDKLYDPENPIGIYKYMEEQQPIKFYFGYELDNGSIEWIKCGDVFTTGEVQVDSDLAIPKVTFSTTSAIGYLTNEYQKGSYTGTNKSLYDLAEEVLLFSNLPVDGLGENRWIIDSGLETIYTLMPLPKKPVRELLQLIANAGMCVLNVDRDGYIRIEPQTTTTVDFGYTFADVTTIPKTTKYPQLMGVDTVVNQLTVESSATEIGRFTITDANSTLYEFEYELATNVSSLLNGTLSLVGTPEYYGRMCRLVLTGSGDVILNGKRINVTKKALSVEFNSTGERCPIENELITDEFHGAQYAEWIGDYVSRRNEYEFAERGFPELDVGDNLTLNTLFTEDVEGTLLSNEITFDGTLKAKSKILKK